ncbi:nucleoside deaminase [Sulfurimonas sp. CVO]|jgi:guanine deaminase|uniref:Nucleoside deaminase n=1 Tax=Sulfurimonas xiamenensis TaxID=2590021 RepID=A0AAJ4DN86_9BACT|nr:MULTISPECIES: nucleoside deaminase [Sulfurimonas]PLY15484.1 MAG: nucleoside deaminase [Sulfurimonas sp.]QFR43942.1 nucleoside deaminase [Sulfurimonas xiamenensis]QHG90521.1 nucleoside deaminase [Sulfurimonas sp. CVO]
MNKFMREAVKEAFKGVEQNHGGPFGAVIVKEGKIISKAHNEVIKQNDPTLHAEINAIKKASKKLQTFDLSGCEIYITCMPCPMCMGAIRWANIKTVYYGATSKDADKIGFRDKEFYEKEFLELKNIDREECLKPFKAWSAKEDKILY